MDATRLSLRIYSHVEDAIREEAAFQRTAVDAVYQFEKQYSPQWFCLSPCAFLLNASGMETLQVVDEGTGEIWIADSVVYSHDGTGLGGSARFKAYLIGKIQQPEVRCWEVHLAVEVCDGG